jgi:hypothetical protein
MISTESHQTDVSHDAAAVARWDDEGGASMSARSNTGVRVSKDVRSKRMVETTADLKVGTLPTKIQRELFEHATSLADLGQIAPPKSQIARFLHDHKDDGDRRGESTAERVNQRLQRFG